MQSLIIGTRYSALALWQTEHVATQLRKSIPNLKVEIKHIKTEGDRVQDRALWQVAGRGFFVKEIENALLSGEVDIAVHSLKDVPTVLPDGLILGAIPERADSRDALIVNGDVGTLSELPNGARVGTSSLRRRAQLLAVRPDLEVADLRGNVGTRLRKLHEGEYDAIVLAAAGLDRLELQEQISQRMPLSVMLPAPAQGALAIQCRADDLGTLELLRRLDHWPTRAAVVAERAFLNGLSGGCSTPVAAHALELEQANGRKAMVLNGLVASLDGKTVIRVSDQDVPENSEQLGLKLAQEALSQGARAILEPSL